MSRRGHVLGLILMVMLAFGAAGLVVHARLMLGVQQREADEVRLQAIWLARSAALAGTSGRTIVDTVHGPATVVVGEGVTVSLWGARASVREGAVRYTPGPR